MTFPGAGAQIYRNEAGEPLGWDYPGYDEGPDPDDFDNFDEDAPGDWAICDDCGNEYEYGDPEIEKHKQETGHTNWS